MMELAIYDAYRNAIDKCHAIDELQDMKDKARALEIYAMQAKNIEAERKACDIRLRAERRLGILLKELARAEVPNPNGLGGHTGKVDTSNGGTKQPASPYAKALTDNQMSRQSAHRYEKLAEVPEQIFNEALADPIVKPTTNRLIESIRDPTPQTNKDALWIWGRLRDFEREYKDCAPDEIYSDLTEAMRADIVRIAPVMISFLTNLYEVSNEKEPPR